VEFVEQWIGLERRKHRRWCGAWCPRCVTVDPMTKELRISDFEIRIWKGKAQGAKSKETSLRQEIRNSKFSGALSLGMRRLSIIDIEGGHQPVFNEDGQIGGILNGEIYNFQELRRQLEDRGHKIRTRSDSEVMVHAYEEWGEECVEHFEGMFAIAIFDQRSDEQTASSKQQTARSVRQSAVGGQYSALSTQHSVLNSCTLFLARDRLGIKPLYYFADGEAQRPKSKIQSQSGSEGHWTLDTGHWTRFLFASEVRTLLASGAVPRQLSKAAVESYLLFGSVSEPMTLIEGVFSLPPGHRMTINLADAGAVLKPECYWHIADPPRSNGHGSAFSATDAAVRVRGLLAESVRKHLIADVPVGVFLSGGIDSTAIAALASEAGGGVHTFTVAFEEEKFNEAAVARRTAQRLGSKHEELLLRGADMLARLDEALAAMDQPSMDAINTYFVSWAAREKGVKVALSGLGGDEVFGGYRSTFDWTARYRQIANVSKRMPAGLRSRIASALAGSGGRSSRGDAARKLAALWGDPDSFPHAYYFARTVFPPPQMRGLMNAPTTNGAAPWRNWLNDNARRVSALDTFAAVTCLEAGCYLVNTLLRDTDFMSMAHSLEVRVPFLDHPLVEFVTHLPEAVKRRHGTTKALLVAALGELLPDEVTSQRKRGFTIPLQQWLGGPLRQRVEAGLSDLSPSLGRALKAANAQEIWQSHLRGQTNWSRPWSLYVLNEWVKKHIDQGN
jgi:asparagine synthase (glutamine-hydrolysing)